MRRGGLRSRASVLILGLLPVVALAACGTEPERAPYVARLGDRLLTAEDVETALASAPATLDSAEYTDRFVEQWVTSQLLHAEAVRRGLRSAPEVRHQIEESERAILISALLDQVYDTEDVEPTPTEITTYFETHKSQLGLLEPFVRIRYLQVEEADSAALARQLLSRVDTADAAGWIATARRFSADPEGALDLSGTYAAESRLLAHLPQVRTVLERLPAGRTSPVIEDDGAFHVVQVVDRVPTGTVPRIAWIEAALRQRLRIESRKQLYARLVQQLRNEAVARERLDVPDTPD